VIERDDDPSEWLSAGQEIMALPEPTLIKSIFNRNVPVHDGALFLSQGRIAQMGCILPLSEREDIPKKYGTRHRAALGLTEQTDALCLVVSEETGEVSTAVGGILTVWNDPKLLASRLNDLLKISELPGPTLKGLFRAAVLENWGPKLIALALVAIAWMALVTQQNIKTTVIAQIQYMNIPRGLVLAKDSANSVKLTLSGRRYNIRSLENHEVGVQVDLAESPVGTQQKRLSARNIDLPLGINIEQVTPQEIKITLKTSEKGYRPEPPLSEAYP
jgi:diadenylate cyclase